MLRKLMHIRFLLLIIILSSVSVSKISLATNMNQAVRDNMLAGTWSSTCARDDSGNYNIETFKFSGNSAVYSVNTYRDAACKNKLSKLTTYRIFKLGDSVSGLANTRKLDYEFKSVTMTYTDPTALKVANTPPGAYGFTDWKLNQSKEVANLSKTKGADKEKARGEKFYTIVKRDNNKLYMGDYASGAGTSAATRLSAIYKVPFVKQK